MSRSLPGESRYGIHSIDHFALEVPSLAKAEEFFTLFGLEVSREPDRLALRTVGDASPWSYIHEGPAKRLAYLSFGCFAEEYDGLLAQIQAASGVTAVEGVPRASREGFWFRDPDGNLMQLKVGRKRTPSAPTPRSEAPRRAGGTRLGAAKPSAAGAADEALARLSVHT